MKDVRRWLLLIVLAMVLCAAWLVDRSASHSSQASLWQLSPLAFDGFYGSEESTTLPGSPPGQPRKYHWSEPSAQISLWPPSPATSVLKLEYLDPFGQTTLQINQEQPILLTEARLLRRAHILLPPADALTVHLQQTSPQSIDGRTLGLIVGDVHWVGLGWGAGLGSARQLLSMPLTIALAMLLAWLVWRSPRWVVGVPLALLGLLALLALRWPADVRAGQTTLQCLLVGALLGWAVWQMLRRWRPTRWTAVLVGVWLLSLLLFLTPGVSSDGVGYYAYVRSVFIDGDLNFTNEFDGSQSPFTHMPLVVPTARPGYVINWWSVGPAIYWTPFWLLGHALTYLGGALGLDWQPDGYAPPYIILVMVASALAGLITMLGCQRLLQRWFSPAIAALAAFTLYIGSNLFYYTLFGGAFGHIMSSTAITLMLLASFALDDQPTLKRWLLLGVTAGMVLLTYWMTALMLIVPLCVGVRHLWLQRHDRAAQIRLLGGGVLAVLVAMVLFFPQMLVWKLTMDSWLTVPQGSPFAMPQRSNVIAALFGSLYGLAWWTPALFLGLVGLVWFARWRPWPGVALLLAALVYLLYNVSLLDWHGSGGFGLRRLTSVAPLLSAGLALLLDRMSRYRALLVGALALWSVGITMRYLVYLLPHAPFELRSLGLRPILLTPDPFSLDALLFVIERSWFVGMWRSFNLGHALILTSVVLVLSFCAFIGKRYILEKVTS
jgi:hypothetical protein